MMPEASRRAEINAIGQLLSSIREVGEDAVSVSFATHAPNADCRNGFVSVAIDAGPEHETAAAVNLVDALLMARARVKQAAERRAKAEAEKAAVKLPSNTFSEIGDE